MTDAERHEQGILDSDVAEKAAREADVVEILEKYDKESVFRVMDGGWGLLIKIICVAFSLFQLYTATFGAFPTQIQRATHLGFTLCLAYLLYPSGLKKPRDKMAVSDVVLAALATWV
ncbi:MAG: hypothetical protein LBJ22_02050, partial [Synergistaceae bacterium]|nr:hypothetical protein [Synergistaceae bacterium]